MSARILVAGRSEICRELFDDPEAYGSHIADRLSCINKPVGCLWVLHYFIMKNIRLIGCDG